MAFHKPWSLSPAFFLGGVTGSPATTLGSLYPRDDPINFGKELSETNEWNRYWKNVPSFFRLESVKVSRRISKNLSYTPGSTNIAGLEIHHEWRCISYGKMVVFHCYVSLPEGTKYIHYHALWGSVLTRIRFRHHLCEGVQSHTSQTQGMSG